MWPDLSSDPLKSQVEYISGHVVAIIRVSSLLQS